MRLNIRHTTSYLYQQPATSLIQTLRLTPRNNANQYVRSWRIDLSVDARLRRLDDPFGGIAHYLTIDGPIEELSITAAGEVETDDSHGVVSGSLEKMPPDVYLRSTPLTEPDEAIEAFALAAKADGNGTPLDTAHSLMTRVNTEIAFMGGGATTVTTKAPDVLKHRRGVCQDLTHLFIAGARRLGLPARYVGGYLYDPVSPQPFEAGHAWAEVLVPDLGWVGFDPTACVSPSDGHVRVAVGLDYLGVAPVRGARHGGFDEALTVELWVQRTDQPADDSQSQSQSQSASGQSQAQSGGDDATARGGQSQSQ